METVMASKGIHPSYRKKEAIYVFLDLVDDFGAVGRYSLNTFALNLKSI